MKDRLVDPRAQAVATELPEHVDGDPGRDRGEQPLPATGRARVLAATALVLLVSGVVGAVGLAVDRFPRGLVVAVLLAGVLVAVAFAAVHLGAGRWIAVAAAVVLFVGLVVVVFTSPALGVLAAVALATKTVTTTSTSTSTTTTTR